ncbi:MULTISPECIES: hypothetical protein [unclassified Streptomyces]|uniref:hypothetical protein n=1 Tax=unclassified Streptomyces TaxID=2593676 RepID=UPI002E27E52F|nr:hypothetical protein [Streptomyces sp. NBC_00228]
MSSTDEQDDRASGSVPNAFGNALAWKWMPNMPASLKRSNLHTLLYTLRTIANADGALRYRDTKRPFTLQAIAKAAGCDQKDARDRLEAAIRAGVVAAPGERRKGRSTLYVIVPSPFPDWSAAAAYLDAVKEEREASRMRREAGRKAAPWTEENGGRSPELEETEKGGPPPELTDGNENGERGAVPLPRKGGGPPTGTGGGPPYTPGGYPWGSHDGAEVGFQPQVVGASGPQDHSPQEDTTSSAELEPGWINCERCHDPMLPRFGRRTHAHCPPVTDRERHTA